MLGRVFSLIVGAALLVLGFMFSLILLVVIAVLGLAAFGYFWWKTRASRNVMREQSTESRASGQIIEGEAVVIEEYRLAEKITPE